MGTVLRMVVFASAWALAACGAGGLEDAAPEALFPEASSGIGQRPPSTDEFKGLLPSGSEILAVTRGDIDASGHPDVVLAVDDSTPAEQPRSLLLLVRGDDGNLRLAARNDRIVPCHTCGGSMGEPSVHLDSDTGTFTLTTEGGTGWLWSNEYVFEHDGGDRWLLKTFTRMTSSRTTHESEQTILTSDDLGAIDFVEFDPEAIH